MFFCLSTTNCRRVSNCCFSSSGLASSAEGVSKKFLLLGAVYLAGGSREAAVCSFALCSRGILADDFSFIGGFCLTLGTCAARSCTVSTAQLAVSSTSSTACISALSDSGSRRSANCWRYFSFSSLARWRGSSIAVRLLLGWPILGFSLNSGNPVHPLNVSQFETNFDNAHLSPGVVVIRR